jgi:hypothetical protein
VNELSQHRLEVELALKPEPLTAIREDAAWFHVGAVSISKQYAGFSAGFAHPMVPETHLLLQPFVVGAVRGWALVLVSGGNPSHYFAGWLPFEQEALGRLWVDKLNVEIQKRVAPQLAERAAQKSAPSDIAGAQTLACHFANMGGEEVIRLTHAGDAEYVRRVGAAEQQRVSGRADASRLAHLLTVLATTEFPTPPQRFFPPGATICTLVVTPPERKVALQHDTAVRLHGYDEIIRSLEELTSAIRDSDQVRLASWGFEPRRS